jgi:integrase
MKRRPKGSGTIRKRGGFYSITYGTRAAPQHEGGFRTKAEAERRLTLIRAEAMQRRLGHAADPRLTPTLAVLSEPWLERRKATHAAGHEDGYRWRKHLEPHFGHLRPDDVDAARLRAFVEAKRAELKPGTIRVCLAGLSSLYEDLLERGLASANPARRLPKSLLRLVRPDHDPRTTPFVERLEDVRRIYLALPEPLNVAYAIGALAGLRTGEVFALRWISVDLGARRILVSESIKGATKDRDPRAVPILDPLLPVLEAWRLRHPGPGRVIPPLRCDGKKIDKATPGNALRPVLERLGLAREGLGWYECTRHSFASHWAMAGRPLVELQKILGHSSIAVTERYAHLSPGYFAPGVHGALAVDLSAGGEVASIADHSGQTPSATSPTPRKRKRNAGAAL